MLIVIAIITAIVMQARIQAKTHIVTAIVMQARIQAKTHIITAIAMRARIQAKTHIVILTIKRINRNVTVDSGKMQYKNNAEITHMVWKPYGFSSYNIVKK